MIAGRRQRLGGRLARLLPSIVAGLAAASILVACGSSTADDGTAAASTQGQSAASPPPSAATTSSTVPGAPGSCRFGVSQNGRIAPLICGSARRLSNRTSRKVPLVIALHGSEGNPVAMQGLSHFAQVADQHGFIVAFLGSSNLQHPWSPPSDLPYVSGMIDALTRTYNVDARRVYVTGFSAGGAETWLAGCKLSKQVAAIAIVSGAMNGKLYRSCAPSRPVSELLMVGDADGTRWTGIPGRLPSPQQTTARWRGIDSCTSTPVRVRQVSAVQQTTWTSCKAGAAVALYVVQGAGHVWPPIGIGAPRDYSASEAVWAFLSAHAAPAGNHPARVP